MDFVCVESFINNKIDNLDMLISTSQFGWHFIFFLKYKYITNRNVENLSLA